MRNRDEDQEDQEREKLFADGAGEDMPMQPDERTFELLEIERSPMQPAPAPEGMWSIG